MLNKTISSLLKTSVLTVVLLAGISFVYSPTPVVEATTHTVSGDVNVGAGASSSVATIPRRTPTGNPPGILSCFKNPIDCALHAAAYMAATTGAFFVQIGAWIVSMGLIFNSKIFEATAIRQGFTLVLSVANLAFILGIIFVAIATILRMQSYSIKEVLWKLIVMAIAVNFSWLFAQTALNASNNVTDFFLRPFSPVQVSEGGVMQQLTNFGGFVDRLVGAFTPQGLWEAPNAQDLRLSRYVADPFTNVMVATAERLVNVATNDEDKRIQAILNLVFIAVFTAMVAFILLALGIILIIRFVYIAILLILMPIAWMSWAFPAFHGNFTKWMQQFIRWTIYPPVVVFFLYIAISTATSNKTFLQSGASGLSQQTMTNPRDALQVATGNAGIVDTAGQMILVLGLAIGGLFAASALSLEGANQTLNGMKSLGAGATKFGSRHVGKRVGGHLTDTDKSRHALEAVPANASRFQKIKIGAKNLAKDISNATKGSFAAQDSDATKNKEHQEHVVHSKQGELETAKSYERRLANTIKESPEKARLAQQRLDKLEGEELPSLQRDLPTLEGQLRPLEEALQPLRDALVKATKSGNKGLEETLRQALASKEKIVQKKQGEINKRQGEIDKKQDEIKKKKDEIEDINTNYREAQTNYKGAEDDVETKKKAVKTAEKELEDKTKTAERNPYRYGMVGDVMKSLEMWSERENRQPISVRGVMSDMIKMTVIDPFGKEIGWGTFKAGAKSFGVSASAGHTASASTAGHAPKHTKPAGHAAH